jgi:hypothetical protein
MGGKLHLCVLCHQIIVIGYHSIDIDFELFVHLLVFVYFLAMDVDGVFNVLDAVVHVEVVAVDVVDDVAGLEGPFGVGFGLGLF